MGGRGGGWKFDKLYYFDFEIYYYRNGIEYKFGGNHALLGGENGASGLINFHPEADANGVITHFYSWNKYNTIYENSQPILTIQQTRSILTTENPAIVAAGNGITGWEVRNIKRRANHIGAIWTQTRNLNRTY